MATTTKYAHCFRRYFSFGKLAGQFGPWTPSTYVICDTVQEAGKRGTCAGLGLRPSAQTRVMATDDDGASWRPLSSEEYIR